ncbi:rho GTPase-activating protein 100F isoform X2 [Octopus sinensis]|uniref:Rho GTPase-activating protein 100F isoform X2 n=1 Tax=Octopus sinensis TaxID=2607531 RepID=A0A7E6F3H0_9MOLL|nr:rho GTPase-activating protein 100F isoform X2 [Octopus sinensis]
MLPSTIPGGFHDDRWSQERLRDILHTKAKYGRITTTRSRSPECYNSDSEVIYAHPHPRVDPRGFASDYETYAGVTSDDEIYSIPHISASSSTELQLLLKKFNTLSQELQQEQNRLQKQIFARSKAGQGQISGSRSSVTTPDACPSDDYYDWTWAAVKGSPGPTRKAAATQTPARSQMVRKHSTDSLLAYRTYQMDDPLAAAAVVQGQKAGNTLPSVAKTGKPVGAAATSTSLGSPVDRAKRFDANGRTVTRPASRFRDLQLYKKPLQIHYGDYESYRSDMKRKVEVQKIAGLDGMLGIHVLSGQGLKSSRTTLRDLYCVVAVDSINKARTMIRTGAVNFDWDEAFDIELEEAKEVSFLIYNWDPNFKHRLCFHGSVVLPNYIVSGENKHVALKVEPKGVLYIELLYKKPAISLQRLPSSKKNALFGTDLDVVISRENSGFDVPLIVKKCIEEIEIRGLEVVGIYRLCGSARRKSQLRELFEKNSADVNLSVEFVTDIHTITGVLKDYLRELPEPLFTNVLYQMLLDALTVRLPGDPDGSAKLMLSILECLPKANQDTMTMVLNHLKKVASKSDLNKMTPENVAVCFGPVLLCPSPSTSADLDFRKHIDVLKYLLEIWPDDFK